MHIEVFGPSSLVRRPTGHSGHYHRQYTLPFTFPTFRLMSAPYRASWHPYSLSPRLKWSQQQARLPIPIPSVSSNVPRRLMFDPPSSRHPQPTVPDVVPVLRTTFHLRRMSLSRSGPIPDLLPQAASQRPPHAPSRQIRVPYNLRSRFTRPILPPHLLLYPSYLHLRRTATHMPYPLSTRSTLRPTRPYLPPNKHMPK